MHLLIGPTNAGKSTWIAQHRPETVVFAYQCSVDALPPSGSVLHYNLLSMAPARYRTGASLEAWDLTEDPLICRCLENGHVDQATVIVAPIAQLLSRARQRRLIEASLPDGRAYPSDMWLTILETVDHFALYHQLFDMLERNSVPYRVLYNANERPDQMRDTDRCYVHHALRGQHVSMPENRVIESILSMPGAEYQSVLLPGGRQTGTGKFTHTEGARRQSFDAFRDGSLAGRSVLDIGCAMGDMLFWYERYGATKLTGIDSNPRRLGAGQAIRDVLHSRAELIHADFLSLEGLDPHDDVLALNVIHHVADFHGFLSKAAGLARNRLIVEFPTLADEKFRKLSDIPDGLDDYPVIGVSGKAADQTFVFSPAALVRMISDLGDFTADIRLSPMANRRIAVFSRR